MFSLSSGDVTKQYSYVVVFTQQECDQLSKKTVDKLQLLQKEEPADIERSLADDKFIYQGKQMVFAQYKTRDPNSNTDHNIHSENRLLSTEDESCKSHAEKLLSNNHEAACVIFYTLNSPCVSACMDCMKSMCIIPKLYIFNRINSRAFVYKDLYIDDLRNKREKEMENGFTKIYEKIPLIRCFDGNCIDCFKSAKDKINSRCILNKKAWIYGWYPANPKY